MSIEKYNLDGNDVRVNLRKLRITINNEEHRLKDFKRKKIGLIASIYEIPINDKIYKFYYLKGYSKFILDEKDVETGKKAYVYYKYPVWLIFINIIQLILIFIPIFMSMIVRTFILFISPFTMIIMLRQTEKVSLDITATTGEKIWASILITIIGIIVHYFIGCFFPIALALMLFFSGSLTIP